MLRQPGRRGLADVAYPEREQEPGQGRPLGRRYGRMQFLRGLLAHALQSRQPRGIEFEQVRRRPGPVALHELVHQLVAEALDVHCTARREVLELLAPLRRAGASAGAARHGLLLLAHHRRPADRAARGKRDQRRELAPDLDPAFGQHAHHLRDDVPGAADHDGIPDAHILAGQLVHVVKRCVADRHAADEHRLETRHRRQSAGAPHLKLDAADRREGLLGGKLVGDGPARRARDEAELALRFDVVDLVDHAVDLIRQCGPRRAHVPVVLQATFDRFDHA